MAVSQDITESRAARRAMLARLVEREFGPAGFAGKTLGALIDGPPRVIITSLDIDAVVTASILSEATGWKIGAVITTGSQCKIRLHPDFTTMQDVIDAGAFGADVFSLHYPNVSNHPVFLGSNAFNKLPGSQGLSELFDKILRAMIDPHQGGVFTLNGSAWAGIEAADADATSVKSVRYKYPMGSAQILLALLESIGRAPVVRDLTYMPWLIANCDGGLSSISVHGYNVEPWWDALAVGAGEGTFTMRIREMVRGHAAEDFSRVVRALHGESPDVAKALDVKWNLASKTHTTVTTVAQWISDLCGWSDPFRPGANAPGGAHYRTEWHSVDVGSGKLTVGKPGVTLQELPVELHRALNAAYMSVSQRLGVTMDWVMPT